VTYLNDVIVEKCKVNLPSYDPDDRLSSLDNDCIDEVTQLFKNSSQSTEALNQCPEECSFVEYSIDSSHAEYPSEFYKRIMKDYFAFWKKVDPSQAEQASKTDFGHNVLSVNIFYKELAHYSVDEKPSRTLVGLIADIGRHF